MLTDLKNRGVRDVLIASVDGLKRFPQAIESVFSQAQVQLCIVHLVRASLNYVNWKERQMVAQDLNAVYRAQTAEEAGQQLGHFAERWDGRYPTISNLWRRNWAQIIPFFAFPAAIRKVIYTTNAVESLNMSLRKAILRKRPILSRLESATWSHRRSPFLRRLAVRAAGALFIPRCAIPLCHMSDSHALTLFYLTQSKAQPASIPPLPLHPGCTFKSRTHPRPERNSLQMSDKSRKSTGPRAPSAKRRAAAARNRNAVIEDLISLPPHLLAQANRSAEQAARLCAHHPSPLPCKLAPRHRLEV